MGRPGSSYRVGRLRRCAECLAVTTTTSALPERAGGPLPSSSICERSTSRRVIQNSLALILAPASSPGTSDAAHLGSCPTLSTPPPRPTQLLRSSSKRLRTVTPPRSGRARALCSSDEHLRSRTGHADAVRENAECIHRVDATCDAPRALCVRPRCSRATLAAPPRVSNRLASRGFQLEYQLRAG